VPHELPEIIGKVANCVDAFSRVFFHGLIILALRPGGLSHSLCLRLPFYVTSLRLLISQSRIAPISDYLLRWLSPPLVTRAFRCWLFPLNSALGAAGRSLSEGFLHLELRATKGGSSWRKEIRSRRCPKASFPIVGIGAVRQRS
jgi:hypothetical protein